MKVPVEVLSTTAVAPGVALTALSSTVVPGAVEGARELGLRIAAGRRAVILVDEGIYDALPMETRRLLARQTLPMVVPFPLPAWAGGGPREAYIVELLRQAIGYRVRLR